MANINPYESPQAPNAELGAFIPEQARMRLIVPAYGLLASVLVSWFNVAYGVFLFAVDLQRMDMKTSDLIAVSLFAAVVSPIYLFVSWLVLRGFFAMIRLQDPRAALWGARAAILPCSAGCIVALPFALWADWVLRDPRVWAAFRPERLPWLPWKSANDGSGHVA